MADLYTFTIKTVAELRNGGLRAYRALMARLGLDVSVAPDTEVYQRFEAMARQIAVANANIIIKADEMMPDTATGEALGGNLDRWAAALSLSRNAAVGAVGTIVFDASAASLVGAGAQLVDGAGLVFEVTTGGTYNDGDSIPINGVSTGKQTNLAAGTTLRWVAPPGFSNESATVGAAGLSGGADEENDDALRARILYRLGHPPASGNWSDVALDAESSSPLVQRAFVYPALQGPGTVHFAVTAAPTSTSKTRVLSGGVVSGTVTPYVQGALPEHVYVVGTSVTDQNVDVAFGLSLPSAPNASPPGPGGGWLDATPWPQLSSYASGGADVTAKTSDSSFTVNASQSPLAGVSRVAWVSRTDWTIKTATVVSYTGTGPWEVTLDAPLTGIAVGDWVFPQASNQDAYLTAILDAFALLGPGEKTAVAAILDRGFRHPAPSIEWPSQISSWILRQVENVGTEVLDTSYLYRSATTPTVPGAVTSPPNIFVPRKLAWYPTQ